MMSSTHILFLQISFPLQPTLVIHSTQFPFVLQYCKPVNLSHWSSSLQPTQFPFARLHIGEFGLVQSLLLSHSSSPPSATKFLIKFEIVKKSSVKLNIS